MCGILGLVSKNKKVNVSVFESMLSTLSKRGPDQSGIYINNNIALGHARLSIVDLSDNGRQPMQNEDGSIMIVFNGEIYNYLNVKHHLKKKHVWRSLSDTESILHGYEEYGSEISKKIDGMFAYCIFDKRRNTLSLARDRFGKKPLYYYHDNSTFCFSSELKAITKNPTIKQKLKINAEAIQKFVFYGYIPSPETIYENIHKLEPATTLEFDINRWEITNKTKYWSLAQVKQNIQISEADILQKLDTLIDQAVNKRLLSDVPLGLFLSGGIDSSLIAHYMAKRKKNICTYTVSYKDSPEADESKYVKKVVDQYGLDYHLCEFSGNDVQDTFEEIMEYLDEPMADAAIVPLYYVSKQAKKDMSVVLSGDGGDEIFGGYEKYKVQKFMEDTKLLAPLISQLNFKITPNIDKFLTGYQYEFPERQFIFGSGSLLKTEAESLLNKDLHLRQIFELPHKLLNSVKNFDTINKSLYLDSMVQLPDWYLVKGDRATMAASIEMRNPFLDTKLVEFAFSLGGNWKVRNGITKYLLKKMAEKHYSKEFIYRPKRGFGVPLGKWIKAELKENFRQNIKQKNDYFNDKYVTKLYNEHISGVKDNQFKLLRIYSINRWLNRK